MEKKSVSAVVELPVRLSGVVVEDYGESPVRFTVAKEWEQAAYAKGREEAEAFAQAQIVEMREDFLRVQNELFNRLDTQFQSLVSTVGARMPDLVLAMVRRLWGGIELNPEAVENNLRELMQEITPDGEELEVSLCPEDFKLIKEIDTGTLSATSKIRLIEDASLKKGDCMIRSRFGIVDGRIETKLKKIEGELKGS